MDLSIMWPDMGSKGMTIFYHAHPVKFIGIGEMGWWFQHVHRNERYLAPSAGKPVSMCVGREPKMDGCNLCGWEPRIYRCGGSCNMAIRRGGCA